MALSRQVVGKVSTLPGSEIWINEALFAIRHLEPYLEKLKHGARVLEVGSGAGVLLSHLTKDHPTLRLTGIEPLGAGFSALGQYHQRLTTFGADLFIGGYEDFQDAKDYDLIFMINVFEHLPDWRHFLSFAKSHLTADGLCLILCPNYGFPYESHFNLPILFNKSITQKVFRSYIERFEVDNDCRGLWSSLNFVKWSHVDRECKELGLKTNFRSDVVKDLIERLDDDQAFAKRQFVLGPIAKALKTIGVLSLLDKPRFHRINPYMKVEVSLGRD